jgi:hypothetical protein
MKKSRTIFIWDVHWCYNELKLLLEKINIEKDDRVFFVWDLVNKGPDSYKVLKLIYKNKEQYKTILWNHEVRLLKAIKWEELKYKSKIFKKLKEKVLKKEKILNFIKEIPLYIEEDDFLLIHWGLIPNKKTEDHTEDELVKLRQINGVLWYNLYEWEKKVIYGHNAVDWLQIREKTIWLDSWCVYWKSLTAYVLETWEVFSQNALDIYENVYKQEKSVFHKVIWLFK